MCGLQSMLGRGLIKTLLLGFAGFLILSFVVSCGGGAGKEENKEENNVSTSGSKSYREYCTAVRAEAAKKSGFSSLLSSEKKAKESTVYTMGSNVEFKKFVATALPGSSTGSNQTPSAILDNNSECLLYEGGIVKISDLLKETEQVRKKDLSFGSLHAKELGCITMSDNIKPNSSGYYSSKVRFSRDDIKPDGADISTITFAARSDDIKLSGMVKNDFQIRDGLGCDNVDFRNNVLLFTIVDPTICRSNLNDYLLNHTSAVLGGPSISLQIPSLILPGRDDLSGLYDASFYTLSLESRSSTYDILLATREDANLAAVINGPAPAVDDKLSYIGNLPEKKLKLNFYVYNPDVADSDKDTARDIRAIRGSYDISDLIFYMERVFKQANVKPVVNSQTIITDTSIANGIGLIEGSLEEIYDKVVGMIDDLSAKTTEGKDDDSAINIFTFTKLPGDVLGLDGQIPGVPVFKKVKRNWIIALAGTITGNHDTSKILLSHIIAHELGHYVGLFHPAEGSQTFEDQQGGFILGLYLGGLRDLPSCTVLDDQNCDGILSRTECANKGSNHLMWWRAGLRDPALYGGDASFLSYEERFMIYSNIMLQD